MADSVIAGQTTQPYQQFLVPVSTRFCLGKRPVPVAASCPWSQPRHRLKDATLVATQRTAQLYNGGNGDGFAAFHSMS